VCLSRLCWRLCPSQWCSRRRSYLLWRLRLRFLCCLWCPWRLSLWRLLCLRHRPRFLWRLRLRLLCCLLWWRLSYLRHQLRLLWRLRLRLLCRLWCPRLPLWFLSPLLLVGLPGFPDLLRLNTGSSVMSRSRALHLPSGCGTPRRSSG